jgi:hypothetical protein
MKLTVAHGQFCMLAPELPVRSLDWTLRTFFEMFFFYGFERHC